VRDGLHLGRDGDPLLVFLPILGAPALHAPALRWNLLEGLSRPLDGGRTLAGRRLLGDNKTVRGALLMTAGVTAATVLLARRPGYWQRLPEPLRRIGPWRLGIRIGLATTIGELPNSLVKRQLGIPPGERDATRTRALVLSAVDQVDFVPAVWLFLQPAWRVSGRDLARCAAVVAAAHLTLNLAGRAVGIRSTVL